MKNKYFSPDSVQKRIEEKIEKYTRAFKDEAVKNTLAKMPKNQETLSIIEAELETVVANMPGDSSREQWHNFTQGINLIIGANVNDRKQAEGAIKTLEQDELSIDIDKDLD